MKIARLVAIVVVLLNKGTVTARELAERFEVSTRTIYRDIEALAEAGIPVYATQGNSGGITLMEEYLLDRALLSEAERESLLFALKTLQAVQYPEVSVMLDKLGALFKNSEAVDWVEVEFSPWGKGAGEEIKFTNIRRAILEQNILEFDYVGADGIRSHRVVEPAKLYFKGSSWYLWAWCHIREAYRSFRITRIRNLLLLQESFERRGLSQPAAQPGEKKDNVRLNLRFQPAATYRVYDDFDDAQVVKNQDGTLGVITEFVEDDWVYGYLLSYGSDLEVIEPEHIREILLTKLQAALAKYCPSEKN